MSDADEIKKIFESAGLKTNPQIDEAIIDEMIKAQKASISEKTSREINIWRIIIKSRMVKFAAAAVIIAAICLFFTHHSRDGQIEAQKIAQTPESRASVKLTSLISLNSAFRRGGIEAVEKQFAEAEKKAKRGSKEYLTISRLLCELGQCEEI